MPASPGGVPDLIIGPKPRRQFGAHLPGLALIIRSRHFGIICPFYPQWRPAAFPRTSLLLPIFLLFLVLAFWPLCFRACCYLWPWSYLPKCSDTVPERHGDDCNYRLTAPGAVSDFILTCLNNIVRATSLDSEGRPLINFNFQPYRQGLSKRPRSKKLHSQEQTKQMLAPKPLNF